MSEPILTLEEFRASKREVRELATVPALEAQGYEGGGLVYAGDLVIEWGTGAAWCLTIGNESQESNDLESLEEELYEWALCQGIIDEPVSDESRSTGKRA